MNARLKEEREKIEDAFKSKWEKMELELTNQSESLEKQNKLYKDIIGEL